MERFIQEPRGNQEVSRGEPNQQEAKGNRQGAICNQTLPCAGESGLRLISLAKQGLPYGDTTCNKKVLESIRRVRKAKNPQTMPEA